ncbi:thioredoxin [Putridiphycobacter roseus]|uniref:Thioredoxin n=1 Tax=Putridiphycobacter roseus TaxID=2219161 RepID=A0A2W1NC43_9FLAO|nr:thioredoxin [Putridiphycobacter roseus]PZE15686.1 thioredoxin [Putridiphycobacter roseus]
MSKFGDIISKSDVVLVDFFATWCGPCKALGPILENVSKQRGEKVKIIKIDVDKNQGIASKLMVRGVPTMILYKAGKQVWRQSGVVPENELIKLIDQYSK